MIADPERCTQLPVQNVGKRQKFRSSQMEAGQFTAGTVIRNAGRREAADAAATVLPERCTVSPVPTVGWRPRFRSSLMEANPFTVRTVTATAGPGIFEQELKSSTIESGVHSFFSCFFYFLVFS